jgi:AsmA protein
VQQTCDSVKLIGLQLALLNQHKSKNTVPYSLGLANTARIYTEANSMLKVLVKFFLSIAAFAIALIVGLIILVDANQYKSAIESAVASNTGYELSIAGDLALDFFPTFGLTLNDVRLKNPAHPQELASTSAVSLKIDAFALIGGELRIQEFIADDFHVNYTIDESGISGWALETIASETPKPDDSQPANTETGSIVSATFERISISNASIDIQDLSQNSRYSFANVDLESSATNIDSIPFPVDLQFDYVTYSDTTGLAEPIPVGLRSIVSADLSSGIIEIREFNLRLTPMLLQGQVSITGLNDSVQAAGSILASSFDVAGLMQTLGASANESQAAGFNATTILPRLSFKLDFSGDESQFSISDLGVTLGDSIARGSVDIRLATDFTPTSVSYSLSSSALDLSPFMPAAENTSLAENTPDANSAAIAEPSASSATSDTALPIELLSSFDVTGSLSIDTLKANEYLFENVTLFTNIESSVLDIEIQPVSAFEGTIAGNIRVDGRSPDAPMTSRLNFNQLNLVNLFPSISRFNSVSGKLNMTSEYTASAASTASLMNTLDGSTQFAISENSVDIGVIKQIFTTISALSPTGGSIQQWPDQVQFSQLGGYIVFDNGIAENQLINLKMDNFQLDGVGGIDLASSAFNYQLAFTLLGEPELQTIPIGELYHGVQWPVECAAYFADKVSQYCRPDFTSVRQIFTQLGRNALRGELEESITDKVPDNLRDTARGLLQNLLN